MPARNASLSLSALLAVLTLLLPLAAPAGTRLKPTVEFELSNGAKVSDIQTVTARAKSPEDVGIDKVEFYVDDMLKATDSSTPYEFDWDTLAEKEGSHSLKVVAIDSKADTSTAKIEVTVDNELGKGAEAHAQAAAAALKEGNVDTAAKLARRALKIDPANLAGARVYAGVLRQRGQLADAVAVLDKAAIPDNDIPSRLDQISLHMAKADASDSTEEFLKEAAVALDLYKKVSAARVAGAGTDPMALGDALVAARDYEGAVVAYRRCGPTDSAPVDCVNRQILALTLANRTKEAEAAVRALVRGKRTDVNTEALVGLIALSNHDFKKARESVQTGVEGKNVASLIVAAYADAGTKQTRKAREEAAQAAALAPDNADVQLLNAFLEPDDTTARRHFVRTLELNPAVAEAYAQRAFVVMMARDANRFQAADMLIETGSKLDPKNNYVLMAKALSLIGQRRGSDADPVLNTLLEQDGNGADVHVAEGLNLSLQDKTLKITEHLNTALKLAPDLWADAYVPKPADLIARVYRFRYPPFVLPSSLAK